MAEASEATKKQVIRLLRGREAKRINFTFPGGAGDITCDASSFDRVATAIEGNKVKLEIPASLPPGAGAQYVSGSPNRIEFTKIVGRVQEANLLHEAFHAVSDLDTSNVLAVEEECGAYVISLLYAEMTGLRDSRFSGVPWDQGRTIAKKLLKAWAKPGASGPFNVDATDWSTLRTKVVSMPLYSGITVAGISYTHDG